MSLRLPYLGFHLTRSSANEIRSVQVPIALDERGKEAGAGQIQEEPTFALTYF